MVNYNCIRCGYTNNDKSKMSAHFNRIKMCKPLLNDIIIEDYKKDILNGIKIEFVQKESIKKSNNMTQKDSKTNNICKFCDKSYSRNNNLTRHYNTCKVKIQEENYKENMIKLVENMMELVRDLNNQLGYQCEQNKVQNKQIKEQNNQIKEQSNQIKEQSNQIKEQIKK